MKKLFWLIVMAATFAFAMPAFAETGSKIPFANISAASAATKTSSVYNMTGFKNKTIHVSGVTLGSSLSSVTFKNMSGTVTAECSPTSSGPFVTCVANDYAQTAVSRTTNGTFSWADATPYVRFKWISGTVGGKLKLWFNYLSE